MTPIKPKGIYFGTPTVAHDTLARLIERGYTPALVVTAPDAPRGRGLILTPSPTRVLAEEHSIRVITPTVLDEATIEEIRSVGADYALCVAYGKILPESLINLFPLGILNVHYSLLPKYRGATPLEAALLAGDTETGVTIQRMVKALDAGDIIAQAATRIGEGETARELRPRLIELGASLLADTLPAYLSHEVTPREQDHALATHAHKLQKEDGLLDLSGPAEANWNKYRAFADSIGTYFIENGKRMKITAASFTNGSFVVERVIPEGKTERDYR
jgi:methionyl-tRNA formyltransferase